MDDLYIALLAHECVPLGIQVSCNDASVQVSIMTPERTPVGGI